VLQSQQDDVFNTLSTFAESTYLNLVLAAIKRNLTEDEAAILHRAADTLNQGEPWQRHTAVSVPPNQAPATFC
jgi:hypothetical protein